MSMWSSAGYFVCSHGGCSKKVRDGARVDHECCGHPKHDIAHLYQAQTSAANDPE